MILAVVHTIYAITQEDWNKIQDINGIWTRDLAIPVRCSHQLSYEATDVGSWSIICSGFLRNCINCVHTCEDHSSFDFISAVLMIYFIYIFHIHLFHGNIWTHNWPALNNSGFIAQLVRASRGHGLKSRWSPEFFFRPLRQLHNLRSQLQRFFIWFHFRSPYMIYFIQIFHNLLHCCYYFIQTLWKRCTVNERKCKTDCNRFISLIFCT